MPPRNLIFDLETNGLLNEVTKIHCMVIIEEGTNVAQCFLNENMEEGLKYLLSADTLIGHNILGYDLEVIKKLYGYQFQGTVRDTILCSRVVWSDMFPIDSTKFKDVVPAKLWGQHNLKSWGYRLGILKGDYGEQVNAWETFTPEMLRYCEQDVRVTCALWDKIKSRSPSEVSIQLEHDFALCMQAQERAGFSFNEPAAIELYTTLSKRRLELETQCSSVFPGWWVDMKTPEYYLASIDGGQFAGGLQEFGKFPTKGAAVAALKAAGWKTKDATIEAGPMAKKHTPFNPGSRDHIARAFIEKYAWSPSEYTSNGKPKVDEEVISSLVYPEAKVLGEFLMVGKRIGQLAEGDNAWLRLVKHGRMYGRVITNGTNTGRTTTSNPNVGQIPACDKPYGHACRGLFTANHGEVLVGADASGIQLRALAHYLHGYDGGKYVEAVLTGDIHTVNQHAAGLPTRDNAKTFIYAWVLGAGDEKIGEIVGKGAREGKALKAKFLKGLPALGRLKEDVAAKVKQRGYLLGLDGRVLVARSAHSALSLLLQSFEACIMKKATKIIWDTMNENFDRPHGVDWQFCSFVHDEWQISCIPKLARPMGELCKEAIEQAGEFFKVKCPVTGAYKVGNNWAETH